MLLRRITLSAAALALVALPCQAQTRAGIMGELINDVSGVQTKLVALAKAVPAEKYSWRPGKDVRSVGEVFLHVSADNYMMPLAFGVPAGPATGLTAADLAKMDFSKIDAFEHRALSVDETVDAINVSFAHLKKAMAETPESKLGNSVTFFGQKMTRRQLWMATAMHLHEHLGQTIAYARANDIVPPWSRKGG